MWLWRHALGAALALVVAQPATAADAPAITTAYYNHARPVQAVAALQADGVIATGDSAGVVHLWQLTEAKTALGAELRQIDQGIGTSSTDPLPGPVVALAFTDARCNGASNPLVEGCGLLVSGASSAGFSYLRLYNWRNQRLMAAADVLQGRLTHLAAAPGGGAFAACATGDGMQRFSLDLPRALLERQEPLAVGAGCDWLGYGPGNRLHFAAGGQLVQLDDAAVVDAGPGTAFAVRQSEGKGFVAAIGRAEWVDLYRQLAAEPVAKAKTRTRYGEIGAEALAWVNDGKDDFLLTVGPSNDRNAIGEVTHKVEWWSLPDLANAEDPAKSNTANAKTFNELIALQGRAVALLPLTAGWHSASSADRYRYFAVLDASHRLVLAKGFGRYSQKVDGKYPLDPAFVLSARPYAQAELRLSADAEEACLWPGGGAQPISFRPDGLGAAACQRQKPASAPMPAAVHSADGSVMILPARVAMDFPGDRLRAYTVSTDRRTLFAAVAAEADTQGTATELRRYGLRDDRWAMVGAPLPAAGEVVALGLSDTTSLGIATRQDGPAGAAYQIEAREFEPADTAPALILHGFAPSETEASVFTLCFDVRDPTTPLALHRKDGVRFRVGPAQAAAMNPPQEAAARAVPDDDAAAIPAAAAEADLVAEVLESVADSTCAAAPPQAGMQRFRMAIRLPVQLDGAFDLVPEGGRPEYYIVNFTRPMLYVLAVGIDNYADDRWRLNYAVRDAASFAKLVSETQKQVYRDIEVVYIRDKQAHRKAILVELAKLQRKVTKSDWVMIFFAGHAKSDWVYSYYFLPWDYDHSYPHATQISEYDLAAHLRGIKGKKLLIMDTCYAGNLANSPIRSVGDGDGSRNLPLRDVRSYAERLIQIDPGLILLAASSQDQTARESDRLGHGVFTSTLLNALASPGRFANRRYSGALTVADIRDWIEEEVVRQSRDRQRPVIVGRADLVRAPFWQVAPGSYKGPPLAQTRGIDGSPETALGRVLWQATGRGVGS